MSTLSVRIVNRNSAPVPGAVARLFGGEDVFGADPSAVVSSRGSVTWTHSVTGYAGSLWNAWQKYVARNVAGITWEEFRLEMPQHNPELRVTEGELLAVSSYAFPENRAFFDTRGSVPGIVWDRRITGVEGTLWDCWQRRVQGKVVGLSWDGFQTAVISHNPWLAVSGRFLTDQSYLLPRNEGRPEYCRVAYSSADGLALFNALTPGTYRLEIGADSYLRQLRTIELLDDQAITVTLAWIEYTVERGASAFVTVYGRNFVFDDHTFRFIGVNLRGLVHYGLSDAVKDANAEAQLRAAREMGARVVRIFLPHHQVSPEDTKGRLINLLKLMDEKFRDMFLIVALTNLYADVEFRVPGDDRFYTHKPHGESRDLLGIDWFREGYKANYLPFVQTVVNDEFIKHSPRLMAYNIGNELKAESRGPEHNLGHADLLIEFMHTMARKITAWDGGNHLVSTGMTSTRHAHMAGSREQRVRLYDIPELHFISNHAYHGDENDATSRQQEYEAASRENDTDLVTQLSLPKPVLVEEAGFEYIVPDHDNRLVWVKQDLDRLLNEQGVAGYMPWGFMAGDRDNGDGDQKCGLDWIWHRNDWDSLYQEYGTRANDLAAKAIPVSVSTSNLAKGQQARTRCAANLRREPGLHGEIETLLPINQLLLIQDSARRVDKLVWWPVSATLAIGRQVEGWVAQMTPGGEVLLQAV